MLWNKRKDFLKALLTSANLNSRNKDSFLDQHVENTVTGIHLLKSIFRRDERANNTKIRLHSRRNGSSNWYERLNEPDNTDNAKICVMNTIDKGKASFWRRYCLCLYTSQISLLIISGSRSLIKLITQYVKTSSRFLSLIPLIGYLFHYRVVIRSIIIVYRYSISLMLNNMIIINVNNNCIVNNKYLLREFPTILILFLWQMLSSILKKTERIFHSSILCLKNFV